MLSTRSCLFGIVVALSLLGFALCAHAVENIDQENESEDQTEVVIVATQHSISDIPADYTPGHLRAILKKIAPDIVAVEAPSNVDNPWSQAPAEIVNVVNPWAKAAEIEIVPIGWQQPRYNELVADMMKELQTSGKTKEYVQVEREFQENRGAIPPTCLHLNSDGHHQVWRDYHRSIRKLNEKETPWETWNGRILDNVLQTCKANQGKRIAVVIGGAHGYFLLDGLAKEPNIKTVRIDQFFPLTETEITAATDPIDYLRALHPLNLDVLPPVVLARMEPLLEQLKEVEEFKGDYELFRGKLLLHQKKPKEALKAFEALGSLDPETKSRFDNESKLFETGLVYTALALFQSGDRETALERLKNVIQDQNLSASVRQWAERVLSQIQ